MTLVVRGGDQARLARAVRETVHSLDPEQPVAQLRPMDELVAESVGSTRMSTMLFGLFGGLGLVLAAVGIYGVMSYTVQQGKHEIGVRMALGASPGSVLATVMRRPHAVAALRCLARRPDGPGTDRGRPCRSRGSGGVGTGKEGDEGRSDAGAPERVVAGLGLFR
jgi:hypothetical protein